MRYDPVRLEEQLFKQPVKWLVRNVELFVPLGTFLAKVIFDIQVRAFVLMLLFSKYARDGPCLRANLGKECTIIFNHNRCIAPCIEGNRRNHRLAC